MQQDIKEPGPTTVIRIGQGQTEVSFPLSALDPAALIFLGAQPDITVASAQGSSSFIVSGGPGKSMARNHFLGAGTEAGSTPVPITKTLRTNLAEGCVQTLTLYESMLGSPEVGLTGVAVTYQINYERNAFSPNACDTYFGPLEAQLAAGDRPGQLKTLISAGATTPGQPLKNIETIEFFFVFALRRI